MPVLYLYSSNWGYPSGEPEDIEPQGGHPPWDIYTHPPPCIWAWGIGHRE